MKPEYIEEADRGVSQKGHISGEYNQEGLAGRSEAFRVGDCAGASWHCRKRYSHRIV